MNLSDPNAHLSPEFVHYILGVAASSFRRCNMEPRQLEFAGSDSFLLGDLGTKRFLVYVRITQEDEQEEGCGPVPGILIDAASEHAAEPHLIRIHTRRIGEGIGFEYFGCEEFIRHVLSHEVDHASCLLAPRKFSDYIRMLKGKISKVELGLRKEKENEAWLTLTIDGASPYNYVICPGNLLKSTLRSDDLEIFTCTCGYAACNGVHRGVRVVHDGEYTLWKAYYARGRKVFLFDRETYCKEVIRGCKEVVDFLRAAPENYCPSFEYEAAKKWLEKVYFEATEGR